MSKTKVPSQLVREETLVETMQRGIRQGSLKKGYTKKMKGFTSPAAERMTELLAKIHPDAKIASPVVETFVESSATAAIAELIDATSGMIEKIPGLGKLVDQERAQAAGRWLRALAGEQAGQRGADAVYAVGPILMNAIQNPEIKAFLSNIQGESQDEVEQLEITED